MKEEFRITLLRDNNELTKIAAKWFHEKWGVPLDAYLDSIQECQKKQTKIPQWYLMLNDDEIIAGVGVIENDFHNRKDLTPNICALYVEKNYRKMGIAKKMLDFVCKDLSSIGYDDAYLITEHTNFYEKLNWEFLCMVEEDNGHTTRMYHTSLR
ncbi:MAG: GNAT family N-acetyltransferase [Oscillospiraceae bacterium]